MSDDDRPNLVLLRTPTEIEEATEMEDSAAERTVAEIEETDKFQFLQMVRQGMNRQQAANALDFKGRHFRSLCSPQSPYYDEDFAREYGEAVGSLEHAEGRLEMLRSEGIRRAMIDSDRLLEKFLMVYDPDWAVLRQKDVNISLEVVVQRYFKNLPTEKLEQILQWLDENEGGGQIVEGEISELPGGNDPS